MRCIKPFAFAACMVLGGCTSSEVREGTSTVLATAILTVLGVFVSAGAWWLLNRHR